LTCGLKKEDSLNNLPASFDDKARGKAAAMPGQTKNAPLDRAFFEFGCN
jgi:hypothetical protein